MITLLFALFLQDDTYHTINIVDVASTGYTHVCVTGTVKSVRHEKDNDVHVTFRESNLVAEIIPQIALRRPVAGHVIEVCGISRFDKKHSWPEIHPVISWRMK